MTEIEGYFFSVEDFCNEILWCTRW